MLPHSQLHLIEQGQDEGLQEDTLMYHDQDMAELTATNWVSQLHHASSTQRRNSSAYHNSSGVVFAGAIDINTGGSKHMGFWGAEGGEHQSRNNTPNASMRKVDSAARGRNYHSMDAAHSQAASPPRSPSRTQAGDQVRAPSPVKCAHLRIRTSCSGSGGHSPGRLQQYQQQPAMSPRAAGPGVAPPQSPLQHIALGGRHPFGSCRPYQMSPEAAAAAAEAARALQAAMAAVDAEAHQVKMLQQLAAERRRLQAVARVAVARATELAAACAAGQAGGLPYTHRAEQRHSSPVPMHMLPVEGAASYEGVGGDDEFGYESEMQMLAEDVGQLMRLQQVL